MAKIDAKKLMAAVPPDGATLETVARIYAGDGELPDLWEVRDVFSTAAKYASQMGLDGVALIPFRGRLNYGKDFAQLPMPDRLDRHGKPVTKKVKNPVTGKLDVDTGEAVTNWQPFVMRVPATFWETEAALEALTDKARERFEDTDAGITVVGTKPRPDGGYFVTLAVSPDYVKVRKVD